MSHEDYMKRAFELARRGHGTTWPNPMVGAVLVKAGKIIGEGHHVRSGEAHAEVNAFESATESVVGASLYVNLEPCCHLNKRTPPCAQRVIKEKIKEVFISNLDPNPEVSGKGVQLLRESGIKVETNILEAQGERLNEVFFTAQRKRRPFLQLKLASSLDGMIALPNGESQWITGPLARAHAHHLRANSQGILVGAGTLRKDDPKLNVRLENYSAEQPWRIVLTKTGELPVDRKLFQDELKSKTLIFSFSKLSSPPLDKDQVFQIANVEEMLEKLFKKGIISLLVEGGAGLATELLKLGLIDRLSLYQNPSFLGEGLSLLKGLGINSLQNKIQLKDIESEWIGDDHFITGRI